MIKTSHYSFFNRSKNYKTWTLKSPTFFLDTWVFPLVQMGHLDLEHDSVITTRILSEASSGSRLKFATGYFNLTDQYIDTLINETKAQCDILMAHPKVSLLFFNILFPKRRKSSWKYIKFVDKIISQTHLTILVS